MKKIFSHKLYLTLLVSDLISNFGDTLYYLALMTYVAALKNSNLAISIINISETLPILFTILFGFLADRTINKVDSIVKTLWIRVLLYLFVAVAMTFKQSLLIVVFASFVNLISDTLGQFENGLFYPISNRIVKPSDREEMMAFRQTVTSAMGIVYQSVAVILIAVFSYFNLALINSFTFLCSLVIFMLVKKKINEVYSVEEKPVTTEKLALKTLFSAISSDLKQSLKQLFSVSSMKSVLFVIPFLNAGLAIITPLVVMTLSKTSSFTIINPATTISLLGISAISGGLLGGFLVLTNKMFKTATINTLLKMNLLAVLLLFLAFYFQNIYLVILFHFFSNLFVSSLNPKMGAIIFNHIEETKLATLFGGMVTYFQMGEIISKLFFSGLVIYLSSRDISVIYGIMIILTISYLWRSDKLARRTVE
ncbi:lantibiotic transporter [Streptococcus zalophi]|uniref:lantibiotic transporter n=1 Tax=Streptococcus zalophi TaxID=640031 RepID=UPI00215C50E4|nr:lantibiotic transporter [Streptococcus zalophi]MCR8966990.1 lantibiotic transporter [Streptococcus zalophi]